MSRHSHFQRGSGAFKCATCGRMTRHTGVQSMGNPNCPQCYELAGIDNVYQDEGEEGLVSYHSEIIRLCEEIRAKGGKVGEEDEFLEKIAKKTTEAAA